MKRVEAALAMTPVGYCWGVHIELAPEILWIGDHMERLNYNTSDLHAVAAEVIAPEVVTHLVAHDLGIGYDEALEVLRDETAWNYGRMTYNSAPAFYTENGLAHAVAGPRLIRIGRFVLYMAVIIAGCTRVRLEILDDWVKNLRLCD